MKFFRRRRAEQFLEAATIPEEMRLYRFTDWNGTVTRGNCSAVGSNHSNPIVQSQGISHQQDSRDWIEVTSHLNSDYEELKDWVPINVCLFEARQMQLDSEEHEQFADRLQSSVGTSINPWKLVTGEIDGQSIDFEVVTIESSFAAITQLPGHVVTIVSTGVALRPLVLTTFELRN